MWNNSSKAFKKLEFCINQQRGIFGGKTKADKGYGNSILLQLATENMNEKAY